MRNALQEQLLKAGLASKQQASQARKGKRKRQRTQDGGGEREPDLARLYAQRAREEAAERSRELNRKRREEAERKAIAAEVRQLVAANRLPRDDAEIAYRFVHRDKVKTIRVDAGQQRRLVAGTLAVVACDGRYELVPAEIGAKIGERDARRLVVLNEPDRDAGAEDPDDPDDPYAAYPIPDDLIW